MFSGPFTIIGIIQQTPFIIDWNSTTFVEKSRKRVEKAENLSISGNYWKTLKEI